MKAGKHRVTTALVTAALVAVAALAASSGADAGAGPIRPVPPSKRVSAAEFGRAVATPIEKVVRESRPLSVPTARVPNVRQADRSADGPLRIVRGTAASTAATVNGLWTGSHGANPNRQVGKLYFDVEPGPGVDTRHCTATAINSENKSIVLTAGHCVFSPDPDENTFVEGNRFWHEDVRFCPGYEYSCKLGVWYARTISTTNSWFSGTNGRYDWKDDVAVVVVSPNVQGHLVNAVGGHGITFNQAAGLYRHSFGYPAADSRFPPFERTYNGEDLVYCPGFDTYDPYGVIKIDCTMTGGASGGPWIISPRSDWMGFVNSVNSHKAWGSYSMGGPYFGQAESDLFQYWRNR